VGFIIAGIVEAFKWIADKAVTIAVTLYQVSILIGAAIARLGGFLAGIFKHTFDFFQGFWQSTLRPFVQWSWSQIQKLHAWLKTTLTPLLKFLESVRKDILDIWAKWFRPIFDTIDAIRSTLRLLADFHVPWAQKIDDALAALEARLLVPIRFALGKLNEVIAAIDRVIDFNGLYQRATLIESQWKYVGDLWSVLLKHQPAGLSADDIARRKQLKVAPLDAATLARDLAAFYTTGGGPLAPAIADVVKAAPVLPVQAQ